MKADNMETKFNFNSAICTSIEQSRRLLALGLKKETADCSWADTALFDEEEKWECFFGESPFYESIPAWSLHRLIVLIGNIACDWMFRNDDCYTNAINCIEWLIKEGHFPKEYLV